MARKYYTLLIREDGKWGPQFGDYDFETVKAESDDSYDEIPKRDRKIICTSVNQKDVDAAIKVLNDLN